MPVFNGERYLEEAIRSILCQTHHDLELLVVDDGSSDSSTEIAGRIAGEDGRLRLLRQDHGGACSARNLAIREARGEWIVAMDADDVSMSHRIETLLARAAAEPDVVLWGSSVRRIGPRGNVIGDLVLGPVCVEDFHRIDLCENVIPIFNPTAMFPARLVREVGGYDERLPASQEIELWDRLIEHGPAVGISEPLLLYRLHENTISFKKQRIQKYLQGLPPARRRAARDCIRFDLAEFLSGFEEHSKRHQSLASRTQDIARTHAKIALIHRSEGQPLRAVWHALIALVTNPRFVMQRARELAKK